MRVMVSVLFLLTGCQHFCENYVECSSQVKVCQEELMAAQDELDLMTAHCDEKMVPKRGIKQKFSLR
jgi:hypothetical protein